MDYGRLLSRAWEIIWEHKFLILLGVLVALTSTSNSALPAGSNWNLRGTEEEWRIPSLPEMERYPWFRDLPQQGRAWAVGVPIALVGLAIGFGVLFGIPLWVLSTLSRGGLIAGVSTIDAGGSSSFGEAFGAAWRKGWNLIGIGVLPAIPGVLLLIAGLGAGGLLAGLSGIFAADAVVGPLAGIGVLFAALACILIPIAIVIGLLQTFANQACMLENLNVFDSYRRGLSVLLGNLGSAIVLFLIQIAVSIAIGIVMILPSIIMAVCCFLWPIALLIQGAIAAYFSTMWTLAWREWTAAPAAEVITSEA
jgi:hypothetical protein